MPNKVIEQVHQLASAAKKYKGIVFTDINGNILTDQLIDDMESEIENVTTNEQWPTGVGHEDKQSTSSASQQSIGINDNTHAEDATHRTK